MSRRGFDRERDVKDLMEADGWVAVRAASGLVDVVACRLKPGHPAGYEWVTGFTEVRLIQVKSTLKPYDHFLPAERRALSEAAERCGATAWLAWWPARGSLAWIPEAEWPRARERTFTEEVDAVRY